MRARALSSLGEEAGAPETSVGLTATAARREKAMTGLRILMTGGGGDLLTIRLNLD